MLWGCMSWKGVDNINRVESTMNSERYQHIVAEQYLDKLEDKGLKVDKTVP